MDAQIVGREHELGHLRTFVDAVPSGVQGLVVSGEAGIGKSILWRDALRRASGLGRIVLRAEGRPAEAPLSFSCLTDLLAPVEDDVWSILPPPQRRALDLALLRARPDGDTPDPRATATGLVTLLETVARRRPVLLAIDDVQWIDAASERALAFALRRLVDAPVAVLFAHRTDRDLVTPALVEELLALGAEHRPVGPLAPAALQDLVAARLGVRLTAPLFARIAAASRGNPLHALELARAVDALPDAAPGDTLPLPADLRTAVRARVRQLPAATRDELLRLSAQTGASHRGDLTALAAAEEAGLVRVGADGSIAFEHPLVAAAVYQDAATARRREVHRELADRTDRLEERARHLALATTRPDEDVAAISDRAASDAHERGALDAAAWFADHAVRLTTAEDHESLARRRVRAGRFHLEAGDAPRARALADTVLADTVPAAALRSLALQLAAESSVMDDLDGARTRLEQALELVGDDDPARASELHAQLSFLAASLMDLGRAHQLASLAVELAQVTGDRALTAEARALEAAVGLMAGLGVDPLVLEAALADEDLGRRGAFRLRTSQHVGSTYLFVSALDDARRVFERLDDHLVATGLETERPWLLAQLAAVHLFRGDPTSTARTVDECVRLARLTGQDIFRARALTTSAHAHAQRGDLDAARRDAAELHAIAVAAGWTVGLAEAAWVFGHLDLVAGDPAATVAGLDQVLTMVELVGVYEWPIAMAVPDAIEALVATRDLDRAARLADRLEAWGRRHDRPWCLATGARSRALVEQARGNLDEALDAARAALAAHDRLPVPLELGRTLVVLGQLERRVGKRRMARATLQHARQVFADIGATYWVGCAAAELARIGVRSAPTTLTDNERQVAMLAAAGGTNLEIAAQMHISRRTVEAILARCYRKLGIRSRSGLGTALGTIDSIGG